MVDEQDWNGDERRKLHFLTLPEHEALCSRQRKWIEERSDASVTDRSALHAAVIEIQNALSAKSSWLTKILVSIVFACLSIIGFLIVQGGFAKQTDVAIVSTKIEKMEVKQDSMADDIRDIKERQQYFYDKGAKK